MIVDEGLPSVAWAFNERREQFQRRAMHQDLGADLSYAAAARFSLHESCHVIRLTLQSLNL